ncbi:MAG: hypothetical protein DSY59_03405, partial [Persephonella sp.]
MLDRKESNLIKGILRKFFDKGTIERGRKYYERGMVKSIKIIKEDENVLLIKSVVSGHYKAEYVQEINILSDTMFYSECSCPVGFNCKHAVAVLYKYMKMKEAEQKLIEDKDNWIEFITTKIPAVSKRVENTRDKLIFKLEFNNNYNKHSIRVFKVRNGDFNRLKELNLINLINNTDRSYIDEDLKEILKILDRMTYSYNLFDNILYDSILEKLVNKKILYINISKGAVKDVKEKDIEVSFEKIDTDTFKLKLNVDIDKIFRGYYLYEYDENENVIYRLKGIKNIKYLKILQNSPNLDIDDAVKIYYVLSSLGYNIQKPFKIEEKVINEEPVPVLNISMKKSTSDTLEIKLLVKYGDTIVDIDTVNSEEKIIKGNVIYKIFRNTQKEKSFLKRLKKTVLKQFIQDNNTYIDLTNQKNISLLYKFFEEELNQLEREGWIIQKEEYILSFEETELKTEIKEEDDRRFDLSVKVKINNKETDLLPILKQILENYNIKKLPEEIFIKESNEKNTYFRIKKKEIKPIIDTIISIYGKKENIDKIKFSKADIHLIDNQVLDSEKLKEIKKKLSSFKGIKKVKQPKGLKTVLRGYQLEGLSYLNFLYEYGFNGILADDMGLGKTVQTLSFLLYLKEKSKLVKPALIVVPTSLVANWEKEIETFTPDLSYITIIGKERKELIKLIDKQDIVITTYPLIQRDYELYKDIKFSYIILDEAQKVKNPKTKTYKAVKSIKADRKLALSGTPIENNLTELWALFNLLMPGFLGTEREFNENFKNPIEKKNDKQAKKLLAKKIKPFILRRTKESVLKELPPKIEILKYTKFKEKQAKLYETVRVSLNKKIRDLLKKQELEKSYIYILDALLKLRQIACDPRLLNENKDIKESAKL